MNTTFTAGKKVFNTTLTIGGRNATSENIMYCANTKKFQTDRMFAILLNVLSVWKKQLTIQVVKNRKPHVNSLIVIIISLFNISSQSSPAMMTVFQAPMTKFIDLNRLPSFVKTWLTLRKMQMSGTQTTRRHVTNTVNKRRPWNFLRCACCSERTLYCHCSSL